MLHWRFGFVRDSYLGNGRQVDGWRRMSRRGALLRRFPPFAGEAQFVREKEHGWVLLRTSSPEKLVWRFYNRVVAGQKKWGGLLHWRESGEDLCRGDHCTGGGVGGKVRLSEYSSKGFGA